MAVTVTSPPVVLGAPMIGGVLTVTNAEATGTGTISFLNRWQSSTDGTTWTVAASGVDSVTVTSALVGSYVRALQVISDDEPGEVESPSTAVVIFDAPFFDATVGGTQSTSYVSVDEARVILANMPQSPGIAEWLLLPLVEQQQTLNAATQVLNPLDWKGCKCSCDQRLEWPRTVNDAACQQADCSQIPYDIKLATTLLAATIAARGGLIDVPGSGGGSGGGGSGGGGFSELEGVKSATVGPLSIEFFADADFQVDSNWGWNSLPGYVQGILARWLAGGGGFHGAGWGTYDVYRGSVAKARRRLPTAYTGTMYRLGNGTWVPRVGGWASKP